MPPPSSRPRASASLRSIDAIVGAESLGLDVAEQLATLAPFGQGNPGIRLLVPGARVGDVRPMGEDGKHARFNLSTGTLSARGVAFNANGKLEAAQRSPHDIAVRLEVNHWNGAVEPRAVLADAFARDQDDGPDAEAHVLRRSGSRGVVEPVRRRARRDPAAPRALGAVRRSGRPPMASGRSSTPGVGRASHASLSCSRAASASSS